VSSKPRRPNPLVPRHDPAIALFLEDIYAACNRGARLNRDPLAIVKEYALPADRETVGLIASTLAFGGVDLIMRALRSALLPLGAHPAEGLASMSDQAIVEAYSSYRYRYCAPKDMAALLIGIKRAREEATSLEAFFLRGDAGGDDIVAATGSFSRRLAALGRGIRPNLLPDTARGSACKRLFLYLRWMVRSDDVDPGGWKGIDPARLIVPLDTHMVRVCAFRLGFIERPVADLRRAIAATAGFRLYSPADPVKYDFALTRPGIDPEAGDERFACP